MKAAAAPARPAKVPRLIGRVIVLPNRNALGAVALLAAMAYAGAVQGNGAAYLLAFLFVSVGAVSMIHAWANLRGVTLHVDPIPPVFAGQQLVVPVVVDAERGTRPVAIRVSAAGVLHAAEYAEITPDRERRGEIRLAAEQRGRFERVRIVISSLYPLGFFTARRRTEVERTYYIYPRPEGTLPLPRPASAARAEGGGARAEGEDFAGVRSWVTGESQRRIDWKAAARGQPLLTKQFAGEKDGALMLDWAALGELGLESRLRQLCRWILLAEASGIRYGLRIPGTEIRPASGDTHYRECLRALAAFRMEEPAP